MNLWPVTTTYQSVKISTQTEMLGTSAPIKLEYLPSGQGFAGLWLQTWVSVNERKLGYHMKVSLMDKELHHIKETFKKKESP